jgi:hypothetical protein
LIPAFANLGIRRDAAQRLQSPDIIMGIDEVVEVRDVLGMAVIVIIFGHGLPDHPVYSLDLRV